MGVENELTSSGSVSPCTYREADTAQGILESFARLVGEKGFAPKCAAAHKGVGLHINLYKIKPST